MTPEEKFYEVLAKYNNGIEPLRNWNSDDLLELQEAIEAELEARDADLQREYYEAQEDFWDEYDQEHDGVEYEQVWHCGDPDCETCNGGSYGGTD